VPLASSKRCYRIPIFPSSNAAIVSLYFHILSISRAFQGLVPEAAAISPGIAADEPLGYPSPEVRPGGSGMLMCVCGL
jgi:hypothetical protein